MKSEQLISRLEISCGIVRGPMVASRIDSIAWLFDRRASVCIATLEMYDAPLFPIEKSMMKGAAPKRAREFAAGRAAARVALAEIEGPFRAIPGGHNREPEWPPGFVGSISHCDGLCAAVVGRREHFQSLGFDAECNNDLPPQVQELIWAEDEAAQFLKPAFRGYKDWSAIVFSAKEAFYKCFYPLERTFLDFSDVAVLFEPPLDNNAGSFSVEGRNRFGASDLAHYRGRWVALDDIILTGSLVAG